MAGLSYPSEIMLNPGYKEQIVNNNNTIVDVLYTFHAYISYIFVHHELTSIMTPSEKFALPLKYITRLRSFLTGEKERETIP